MHAGVVQAGLLFEIQVEHRTLLGVGCVAIIDAEGVVVALGRTGLDLGAPVLAQEMAKEIRWLRDGALLIFDPKTAHIKDAPRG